MFVHTYVEFICTFYCSKELENAAFSHHATFCPNESQILSKSPGNPFAIQANWQNMSKEVVETEEERPVVCTSIQYFSPH